MQKFFDIMTRPTDRSQSNQGFSLMEMLITISLLSVVFVILTKGLLGTKDESERQLVKVALSRLSQTIETYRLRTHKYPTTEEGLAALVKSRIVKKRDIKDSFGNEIAYELNGKAIILTSAGPDGKLGNQDDIVFDSESDEEEDEKEDGKSADD